MEQLDAVNLILRRSKKQAVNRITDGDLRSNTALATLTRVRKRVLSTPFPFNRLKTDLPLNAAGKVPIPTAYLTRWRACGSSS